MRVAVERVSVLGPGLPDWATAREALGGAAAYRPASVPRPQVDLLPRNEQRRLTDTIRMALALAQAACAALSVEQRARVPSVFASSVGDSAIADRICDALSRPGRPVSPTRFHNSVHNAPAGYWALATGNQTASTSVAGGEYTASAGLLEAASRCVSGAGRLLLVVYGTGPPPRLAPFADIRVAFGFGMLLCPAAQASRTVCTLDMNLTAEPATTLEEPWEALRLGNPAARGLALLSALARRDRRIVLPHNSARQLAVDLVHDA